MKLVHWLFGGWTAGILLFLYLPIALLILYSFNASKLNLQWEGFTIQPYIDLWFDKSLRSSMGNSLVIACWTTLFSVMLGTLAAWMMFRYAFAGFRTLSTLILIPMIVPEVVMGVSMRIFFSSIHLNLGMLTICIAHVTFCFPFVMVAIQARLAGLDPSIEEAAMDLGATPFQAFMKVIVPYLLPAIIAGALMSFTLSMDEYIVTKFTSEASSQTFPIEAYGMAKKGLNPTLNAISTILIVATAMLTLAAEWLRKLGR